MPPVPRWQTNKSINPSPFESPQAPPVLLSPSAPGPSVILVKISAAGRLRTAAKGNETAESMTAVIALVRIVLFIRLVLVSCVPRGEPAHPTCECWSFPAKVDNVGVNGGGVF